MENNNFKIAVVTDDSKTVSQHFGSAPLYVVFTVENGVIANTEERIKLNPHGVGNHHHEHHHEHQHEHHHEHNHSEIIGNKELGHGMGLSSIDKHTQMIGSISDCKYMISRGMGRGIYSHLERANITPIITDIADLVESVNAVIDGSIVNHINKLH